MGIQAKDISGQTFGELTVIKRKGSNRHGATWTCLCSCGKRCVKLGYKLVSGRTKTCGHRLTHCKRGHEFTPENTYFDARGVQVCRACKLVWYHNSEKKLVENPRSNQNDGKTHCIRGHEFTIENTYRKGEHRICKICRRADQKRRGAGKRSKKVGAEGSHTTQQESELKKFYGNKCLCCGLEESKLASLDRVLAIDHVVPLSKGGSNDVDNLQPLCHGTGGCNNKKRDKTIDYREAGYHYGT